MAFNFSYFCHRTKGKTRALECSKTSWGSVVLQLPPKCLSGAPAQLLSYIFLGSGKRGGRGIVGISVSQRRQGFIVLCKPKQKKIILEPNFGGERSVFQAFIKPKMLKGTPLKQLEKCFSSCETTVKAILCFSLCISIYEGQKTATGIFEDRIAPANKLVSVLSANL